MSIPPAAAHEEGARRHERMPRKRAARTHAASDDAGRARKRTRIIHAAHRCFAQGGFHETTIDTICETVGISKGAFYWYFSGKQAVFSAILERWAERVESTMARQFKDALAGDDPTAAMTRALEMEARRGRMIMPIWLEFLSRVGRADDVRDGLAKLHRRIRRFVTDLLLPTLPDTFDDADRDAVSTMVLACFIGLVAQELVEPERARSRDTVRRFMRVLEYFVEQHSGKAPRAD